MISDNHDEIDVGISQFMSKNQIKIKGITKYRISDFIVNEVSEDNKLVYIDDNIIQNEKPIQIVQKQQTELSEQQVQELKNLLSQDIFEQLYKFISDIFDGDLSLKSYKMPCPEDKQKRKDIHIWIRNNLDNFFSETSNDKEHLEVIFKKNNKNVKRFSKEDSYLHFTVWKTNFDTYAALNIISKNINKNMSTFSFAGNKDKRGITSQRVSLYHGKIDQIQKNHRLLQMKNQIKIGDYSYHESEIHLGQLFGNRFSIALRFVENEKPDIDLRLNEIKQNGFINYFGMQRFGSGNIRTHQIGKLILQLNYKLAFNQILEQQDINEHINEMKQDFLQTMDFSILKNLPQKYKIERTLIEGLKRDQNNYLGAIMNLPKSSRELYPHAYQSYLWNKAVSLRMQRFQNELQIGDMVYNDLTQTYEIIDNNNKQNFNMSNLVIQILGSESNIPEDSLLYTIYKEILNQDELDFDCFQKISKQFYVTGGYRHVVSFPIDLQYNLVRFNDLNQDLITPDFENQKDHDGQEGKYQALLAKFTLKKSNYATMFLRELTQMSSSFKQQQIMNKEIENQKKDNDQEDLE